MAVVNRKSADITSMDATPAVRTNSVTNGGRVRSYTNVITPATDDTTASIGRLVRVPSNCRVKQLRVKAADFTTAGVADIGLYYAVNHADYPAGDVIDVDLFASAFDFAASSGAGVGEGTDLLNESTNYTVAKQIQPLWQAAGLSVDPGGFFDIAYTITTTFNGGQPIYIDVETAE